MKRLILALILCTGSAYGYTPDDAHKAVTSDGSLLDTQNAITYAEGKAQDGWQIIVGAAGRAYTWNGRLNMTNNYVMTLKGASPTNRPVLTVNADSSGFGIFMDAGMSKMKTVRDLIFAGCTGANGLFIITGIGVDCFHHTNLEFRDMGCKVGWIGANNNGVAGIGPFGLIDHCHFTSSGNNFFGYFIRQNELTPDRSWGYPGASNAGFSFGSKYAVYMEDCTATAVSFSASGPLLDGNNSAKVVIRHNHFTNQMWGFHGPDSSGPRQSFMQGEVMHNDWTLTGNFAASQASFFRGGTVYWFDNSVKGNYTVACDFEVHCAGAQYAAEGCKDCNGNVLTKALAYPADYPQCQQAGHPDIPTPRIWSNSSSAQYLVGGDGAFVQAGRNYIVSADASAKPASYTEFAYPHYLNEGGTPQAPVNVSPPTITGSVAQSQTLSVSPGFWTWEPVGTFSYQWRTCDENGGNCSDIVGATGPTYTQTSNDIGRTHRVVVSATNSAGGPLYATSLQNEATVAPGTENRLTNGGFELHSGAVDNLNNDAAWTGWSVTNYGNGWLQSTTSSHGGTYAFEVKKNGGATVMAIEQPFVPANPGETMQVSFWEKNTLAGYGVTYYVKDLTHSTNIIVPTRARDSIGAYTKVETSFIVPPGCLSAKIGFDTSSLGVGGGTSMWLDDVVVAPPASTNRLSPPQNLHVAP